ncbi:exodeoxyribonuclease VII large subunit [Shimia thalassica]|uniref:exodeoxyribonuclease VII large subunit n=1 Tax=Shimia thalassica TaxID=1715693 RepID=UPI001C0A6401|nr:exodeoxyribonuclease VII large subunit [Shimia thalassica]MBU2943125.1 exodeoxyribonuclease VII large subunit [Shimia thalassica]MDO6502552.1 exodeoxyribonuclease VII large subunit [Shimia thalassica]
MSDLIDSPIEGENAPEFSVSEISGALKRTIEGAFGRVRVRGEVGRVMLARSGHLYFDVKDDRSVIAAVSWKGQVSKLSMMPEEGMEVIVTGKLTTFGSQSKYQINVDDVAVAGEGALMAMLEKRKKQLAAEGLFETDRKRPLPYLPEVIGVVTSPSGAVIRDILHRLRERFPRKVMIWPVAVQGDQCAPQVARAIEGFNRMTPGGAMPRPDLIIVARGGGSIEDLWGFNEEVVARAAAASDIPLISAVGHETDTTLIDFVSDRRAPTPTAAAEIAVPVRLDLMGWTDEQGGRLTRALTEGITRRGQRLRDLSRALPRPDTLLQSPSQRLDNASEALPRALQAGVQRRQVKLSEVSGSLRSSTLQRMIDTKRQALGRRSDRLSPLALTREIARRSDKVSDLSRRLNEAGTRRVETLRERLGNLDRMRETLGYQATLERGYAVVRGDGDLVTSTKAAGKAGEIELEFADGRIKLGSKAAPKKTAKPKPPPTQGSLF